MSSYSWSDFIVYAVISHCHFLIYSAACCLFCKLCQPWHFVHHSLPWVQKCSNVTDPYELPDFWLPNSPYHNIFHYKIWSSESTRKNTGCERFEVASDWCMSLGGRKRYWRLHWSVVQMSPCLHSSQRWGGHSEYSPWPKLAKTLLTVIN